MTLSYRHFERKREIFVICGQTANVRKCSNGKPVISDLRASPYLYSAALRSFDSVLLFQISRFFYIRRFPPLRMTKSTAPTPLNLLNL